MNEPIIAISTQSASNSSDQAACGKSDIKPKPFPAISYSLSTAFAQNAHVRVCVRFQLHGFRRTIRTLLGRRGSIHKICDVENPEEVSLSFWRGMSLPLWDAGCETFGRISRYLHAYIRPNISTYCADPDLLETICRTSCICGRFRAAGSGSSSSIGLYTYLSSISYGYDIRSFQRRIERIWVAGCSLKLSTSFGAI